MQVGVIYVLGSRKKSGVCKRRERYEDSKELEEESDM